jgi:hypothetical protein
MRKNGEPMDERDKVRVLGFCFTAIATDRSDLLESFSAVAPDDAWQTYLWLDDRPPSSDYERVSHQEVRDLIQANLFEITGKQADALEKYRALQQQLKNDPGGLRDSAGAGVARLSHR